MNRKFGCTVAGLITLTALVVANGRVQRQRPAAEPLATIDVATAATLYEDHDGVLFIDARSPEQFRSACIPDAVLFDYYNPGPYVDAIRAASARADRIVIYCNGGGCGDSFNAAFYLCREMKDAIDARKVVVFEGGLAQWCAAGLAVDGVCPTATPSEHEGDGSCGFGE